MRRNGHHLSEAKDFKVLFGRGRKKDFSILKIIVLQNRIGHARIACITPKAAEKLATKRNLIRRRAREWIRTKTTVFSEPIDIVLYFKKEAFGVSRKIFYEFLNNAVQYAVREARGHQY